MSSVVSQLDQLKAKIAEERRLALEKKRARRPVLPNRSLNSVVDKVNGYLTDHANKANLSIIDPKKGLDLAQGKIEKKIETVFKPFNVNNDGRMSFPDFKHGLRGMHVGLTEEECESFAQWVDADEDGVIDFDELKDKLKHNVQEAYAGNPFDYVGEEKKEEKEDVVVECVPRQGRVGSLHFGEIPGGPGPGTPGTPELRADDLSRYDNNTGMDESFDYVQEERFTPVKKFVGSEDVGMNLPDSTATPKARTASLSIDTLDTKEEVAPSPVRSARTTSEFEQEFMDQGRFATHEKVTYAKDVSTEELLETRRKLQRSNQEYGLFSPIHPTNRLMHHEATGQGTRNRLGTYFNNAVTQNVDHVDTILREDEGNAEPMESGRFDPRQPHSPMQATREKYKARGKVDHVKTLISTGPQPEFCTTETERKLLLKEKLKERGAESLSQHYTKTAVNISANDHYLNEIAGSKTFSSHMSGASVIVQEDHGHHNKTVDMVKYLAENNFEDRAEGLSQEEREMLQQNMYLNANKPSSNVDHLQGAAMVAAPPPKYKISTKHKDRRTKNLQKTERMVLARLAGSGSVPALHCALKKADGSNSGVLNKEEFKRAMSRFGIELEPNQLNTVMSAMVLTEDSTNGDVGKTALLDNYEKLNQTYMNYETFLDNLDTHNLSFVAEKKEESHTNAAKQFSATGQAQLHPGMHQGRRVAKKLLSGTARLQRSAVEGVLAGFDSSKIGMLKPEELRAGLNTLGVVLSDKEFKNLTKEILGEETIRAVRGADDVKYGLKDVMPAVEAFTSICESDDFEALKARNKKLGAGNNYRSSTVVYPEMPQAKVLSRAEKKERVTAAKIVEAISQNDVKVMKAWSEGEGGTSAKELKQVRAL